MKFTKEIENAIKSFVIEHVSTHQNDIVTVTMSHFGISKPTATKYVNQLVQENKIEKKGNGRYPQYSLVATENTFQYSLEDKLEEDIIWRKDVAPLLSNLPDNVRRASQYCFTEMVNNVIDHSNADSLYIKVDSDALSVQFFVMDDGIGIFKKIQKDLGLEDPKHAILELAKGKFTSDPERHSGEGIFFTSRICDHFAILSQNLYFKGHKEDDWLLEGQSGVNGTTVIMKISRNSPVSIADVFNEYSNPEMRPSFHKTRIPVKLMEYEGEALLSRSQAKRLINRFDRFIEVILDFQGVTEIGQAFSDEVFRVFRKAHPNVNIVPVNCSSGVKRMITYISQDYFQTESEDQQPEGPAEAPAGPTI